MNGWLNRGAGQVRRRGWVGGLVAVAAAFWFCLGGVAEAAITDCSDTDPNTPTAWMA